MANNPGLKRSEIINLANSRTEKKGKTLDLKMELLLLMQEFCQRYRWYWRRKTVLFSTVIGTATYDLLDSAGLDQLEIEQIIEEEKSGVRLNHGGNQWCKIHPIFEVERQECAIDDTTQGVPSGYFIEPGSVGLLRLTPVPNAIYPVRVPFWALPSVIADSDSEDVPLIPGYLHHILAIGLEAAIYRHALGEGSAKFTAAQGKYEALTTQAARVRDFATGRIREFKTSERSVQSH